VKTWFTSDLHLGHRNIIQYCGRPFLDAEEMNAVLILRWNEVVGEDDRVYVVGDFSLERKRPEVVAGWLVQLRGHKHLIRGNHDDSKLTRTVLAMGGWVSVQVAADLQVDGHKVRVNHHPLEDWRDKNGRILLHGHSHNKHARRGPNRFDVGVDANDFRPVTLAQLLALPEGR
jgi:calcineurin-like phosphoesterase family protein